MFIDRIEFRNSILHAYLMATSFFFFFTALHSLFTKTGVLRFTWKKNLVMVAILYMYPWYDIKRSMYCNGLRYLKKRFETSSLECTHVQTFLSREKYPQNVEYPVLIFIMCGLHINKNRALLRLDQCINNESVFIFYTQFQFSSHIKQSNVPSCFKSQQLTM
jgi:hypothetical protein